VTDFFIKPTGSDASDGLSWSTAKASLAGALAIPPAAGDRVFLSSTLLDNGSTTARTLASPLGPSAPLQIYSVEEGLPPTAVKPGATLKNTGAASLTMQGSFAVYGLTFTLGSSSSSSTLNLGTGISTDVIQAYNECTLEQIGTGNSSTVQLGSSSSSNTARSRFLWNNVAVKFSQASQGILALQELTWRGGSVVPGSLCTALLRNSIAGRGMAVLVEGVDLSGLPAAADLINGGLAAGRILIRNCRLPASWTGQLVQGVIDPGFRAEMHNCDSAGTNYQMRVAAYTGVIWSDTAIVKTGGASDGVQGFSWRMETNANPTPGQVGLESCELNYPSSAVGAPVTVSIDVISNSPTPLTNADVWLEIQYLGTAGGPKSSFARARVMPLAAPVAHPASAAAWSGAYTQKQRLVSEPFTPLIAGVLQCKLTLAKPNTILYVDPKLQVI